MANYNLDRIRNALNKQTTSPAGAGGKGGFTKNTYFKPNIGKYDIRFLPYLSNEGEPIQEVLYYEKLTRPEANGMSPRILAPQGFGLPDVIRDLFEEKRKEKDGWSIAKFLKAKKRYYALLIDRKNEAAGVQIWEFSSDTRDDIYTTLVSADCIDEDLMDVDKGYDWELTVTQAVDTQGKPRTFNGNVVKSYKLLARKRPSPLHKDRNIAKKWVDESPKLMEMFQRMLKSSEDLLEIVADFIARIESQGEPATENGTDYNASKGAFANKEPFASKPKTKPPEATVEEDVDEKLDDAFSGM